MGKGIEDKVTDEQTAKHYVAQVGSYEGHLTRIDLISHDDPFSRDSISQFVDLRQEVLDTAVKVLAPSTPEQIEIFAIGPTASIRDLKTVTDRDQRVVDSLVLGGIFLILVALLRQFTIPVYLIVSVFFSYLVTLGVTFAVFWLLDPTGFTGPRLEGADVPVHDPDRSGRGLQHLPDDAYPRRAGGAWEVKGSHRRVDKDGQHHFELRDHHGRNVLVPARRIAGRNAPARLRTGLRRAAGHICRPPDSCAGVSRAPV